MWALIRVWEQPGSIHCFRRMMFILIGIMALPGCGGQKRRVEGMPVHVTRGTINFKGEPLEAAVVTLCPVDPTKKQPASQGVTNEDGEFILSTYNVHDGAPEGEYYVTVSCENRNAKKVAGEFPELLPERYQGPTTSGLKVKIEEGENELEPLELVK